MSPWPFWIKRSSPVGLDKTLIGVGSAAAILSNCLVRQRMQSGIGMLPMMRPALRDSQMQQIISASASGAGMI
jgi:hypothetical protein